MHFKVTSKHEGQTVGINSDWLNRRRMLFITSSLLAIVLFSDRSIVAEEPSFTVDLAALGDAEGSRLMKSLNTNLKSFATVMEHACGWKKDGSLIESDQTGGFTLQFEDPMGKLPREVKISQLSPVIFEGNGDFHKKFLLLCALEMACYHNGESFDPKQKIPQGGFSTSSGLSRKLNIIKGYTRLAIKSSRERSDRLESGIAELKAGGGSVIKLGKSITDEREALARIGHVLEVVSSKDVSADAKRELTSGVIADFSEMMLSRKHISYAMRTADGAYNIHIKSDRLNLARTSSLYRVSRVLSGHGSMPSMRVLVDKSFDQDPDFIFGYGNDRELIFVPGSLVMGISHREGTTLNNGMLVVGTNYTLNELHENERAYFSEEYYGGAPDITSALTHALFCSVGAVRQGYDRSEDAKIQQQAESNGMRYLSSEQMQKLSDGKLVLYDMSSKEQHDRLDDTQKALSKAGGLTVEEVRNGLDPEKRRRAMEQSQKAFKARIEAGKKVGIAASKTDQ